MRLRGFSRREFARGKSYLNARPSRVSEAIQSHSMVRLQPRFYATVSHEISAKLRRRKEGMRARARPATFAARQRGNSIMLSIFSFSQKAAIKRGRECNGVESGVPAEFTAFSIQFFRIGEKESFEKHTVRPLQPI